MLLSGTPRHCARCRLKRKAWLSPRWRVQLTPLRASSGEIRTEHCGQRLFTERLGRRPRTARRSGAPLLPGKVASEGRQARKFLPAPRSAAVEQREGLLAPVHPRPRFSDPASRCQAPAPRSARVGLWETLPRPGTGPAGAVLSLTPCCLADAFPGA